MREIAFARPIIGQEEKNAVLETLDSPLLVHGPRAVEFERSFVNFMGGGYATSTSSATTALQLAYLTLGIGLGDEVIVTSLTHVATANAIVSVGAIPVFVDVDTNDANISVESVKSAITDKTKAICVVHFLGRPVEMSEILEIAKKQKLYVVEDCALALGSRYYEKHVGLLGDFGAFSFYPAKHITTGEGGMLVSGNADLIAEASRVKAFYYDKGVGERSTPGVYDIVGFGLNFRMSEIAASIGIAQLNRLPWFLSKRSENATLLRELISESEMGRLLPMSETNKLSSHYCASYALKDGLEAKRNEIIARLKSDGIGTSVYYPVAIPDSSYFSKNASKSRKLIHTNSTRFARSNIAIGIGPHLGEEEITYLATKFNFAVKELC